MINNDKYDAIGELFRQKLENHQLPVDGDGWAEIERRIGRRKNKPAIWLWSSGIAAAAVIAMLLTINKPKAEETTIMAVIQEATTEEPATVNNETVASANEQETTNNNNIALLKSVSSEIKSDNLENQSVAQEFENSINIAEQNETLTATTAEPNVTEPSVIEHTATIQTVNETFKFDISLFDDTPVKKDKKWMLAASFGIVGNNSESSGSGQNYYAQLSQSPVTRGSSFNNQYAVDLSSNIKSLSGLNKSDIENIRHLPPLSFGLMARNLGKKGGVETGLVYTFLSTRFEFSDSWANYNVHQNLHYIGIPFNMLAYLWNSNSNWQIYFSGGIMAEKGVRATYTQEMREGSQVHRTTTVSKSSVPGLQLSVNSALGVNYRLSKDFGIYFEPRAGYSFDCNQPISIRTEYPVYVGINAGLYYIIKN